MSFNIKVIDLVLKHQNKNKSDVNTETTLFENKSKSSIQQTLPIENNNLHIFYLNDNNKLNMFKSNNRDDEYIDPYKMERLMGQSGNNIHLPEVKTIQMQGHEAMEAINNPPCITSIDVTKADEVMEIMVAYDY